MMLFRHPRIRKYQDTFMRDIWAALENRKILLAEAPTGLGKTDAVLGTTLTYVLEDDGWIFFLTPKISQHEIALEVVEGINKKYGLDIQIVDFVGKRYMCIHPALQDVDSESFYLACEGLRKRELCSYYTNAFDEKKLEKAVSKLKSRKHFAVRQLGEALELCPYEILIKLAKTATVVVADYFHFFLPRVREIFEKVGKHIEDVIVIVDEAHNLPSRLRERLSLTINSSLIERANKELREMGYDELDLNFDEWASLHLGEVSPEEIDFFTEDDAHYCKAAGQDFIQHGRKSALLRLAHAMLHFFDYADSSFYFVRETKQGFSLKKKSLDPSALSSVLNEVKAGVLMSGTLRPLEMYKEILGIENAVLRSYPSPFPEKNRLYLFYPLLTSRYSKRGPELYKRFAEKIGEIVAASPPGVAVFFPSYEFMENVAKYITFPILVQKRRSKPAELHRLLLTFRETKRPLFAVQGGSLAEGIDFSHGEIKVVIIAGLALDEMNEETTALIRYYEKKFGKGWQYGYLYPAIIKALQAAGRAIRKETDRAVIVFMDERFGWKNFKKLMPEMVKTAKPELLIKEFFGR